MTKEGEGIDLGLLPADHPVYRRRFGMVVPLSSLLVELEAKAESEEARAPTKPTKRLGKQSSD